MDNLIWKGFCQKPGMPKGGFYFVFQCLFCQKPFISPGFEVNAGKMTKYCSPECANISEFRIANLKKSLKGKQQGIKNGNYKDGRSFYTQYLGENCELCGIGKKPMGRRINLFVHHLDKTRTNSNPTNLRTVCFNCHMKIHNQSNYGKYPEFQKW